MAKLETRTGFRPDHTSFGKFMLSKDAREPAVQAARDIAEVARATAVRSGRSAPGKAYADSFKVDPKPAPVVVGGNPRVGAAVVNDHPAAPSQEFGGRRTRRHRTLARAGAMIGELRQTGRIR